MVCLNKFVHEDYTAVPDAYGAYHLQGMVIHCGWSLDTGHFYCYQLVRNKWYLFNDAKVTPASWEDLEGVARGDRAWHCPTILFYARSDYVKDNDLALSDGVLSDRAEEENPRPVKRRLLACLQPETRAGSAAEETPGPAGGLEISERGPTSAASVLHPQASRRDSPAVTNPLDLPIVVPDDSQQLAAGVLHQQASRRGRVSPSLPVNVLGTVPVLPTRQTWPWQTLRRLVRGLKAPGCPGLAVRLESTFSPALETVTVCRLRGGGEGVVTVETAVSA